MPLELVDRAPSPERGESPVTPERFAVLQAMLADVLAACGEHKDATIDAAELAARFKLTDEELEDHLQLLNLVNFGGGCYAVYAERVDDGRSIHVEKELYGDEFRRPARLSPLEAKALLLALDLVGPLVAADAGTTLDDVRAKLEAAFGRYDMRSAPTPQPTPLDEDVLSVLSAAVRDRTLVEIEYLGRQAEAVEPREVEPHYLRGVRGDWYCDTWDRTARRRAHVPRRPHSRGASAGRDVRAAREPDRARGRRARRSGGHGVVLVLGGGGALGARPPARHPPPGRRRGAGIGSVRQRALAVRRGVPATSARPCCSSPRRCAPRSRCVHVSSRRSFARTPPPALRERTAGALAERRAGRRAPARRRSRPPSSRAPCSSGWPRARSSCRPSLPSTRAPTPSSTRCRPTWARSTARGVKLVSVFPGNRARGLPAISAIVIVLDSETGLVRGLLGATALTACRTAAASAACAARLAPAAPGHVAITGAGVEARTHLLALEAQGYRDVVVWDHRAANIEALRAWAAEHAPSVTVSAAESASAAAEGAAIVVTGIPIGAEGGRVDPAALRPDVLALPIDYSTSIAAETANGAALLLSDDVAQLDGYRGAHWKGWRPLDGPVGSWLADGAPPRPEGQVVVANLGVGAHDVVFGMAVLERAEREGIGELLSQ